MTVIVHVITHLARGGAQRNTLETAAQLHRSERPQWLITGPAGDRRMFAEAAERLGNRLIIVPSLIRPIRPAADARTFHALRCHLRDLQQATGERLIVHTHTSKAGILGRLVVRTLPECISVHTAHGMSSIRPWVSRLHLVHQAAERVAGLVSDVMVYVSEADRQCAADLGIAPRASTHLIRSGVDPAPFARLVADMDLRREARRRWGIAPDAPLVLTVGSLNLVKDPVFHLRILAELLVHVPAARLLFLGDGPLRAAVERDVMRLGLTGKVLLPGWVADQHSAFAAADVYLLASRAEGFPRSVLEAIASGLPLVVRDTTGWAQEVAWAPAIRTLPRDAPPSSFAAAIAEALAAGRARRPGCLPAEFTLAAMLRQLDDLYTTLDEAARAGPARPTFPAHGERA